MVLAASIPRTTSEPTCHRGLYQIRVYECASDGKTSRCGDVPPRGPELATLSGAVIWRGFGFHPANGPTASPSTCNKLHSVSTRGRTLFSTVPRPPGIIHLRVNPTVQCLSQPTSPTQPTVFLRSDNPTNTNLDCCWKRGNALRKRKLAETGI